jgi:hypothetical protein
MRFVIPGYGVAAICFLSGVLILIEGGLHDSISVWHGNVTVTGIGHYSNGSPTLDFSYDGKHGYTSNTEAVLRFSQKSLPYLWCDVSRTGTGTCYVPKQTRAEK